MFCPIFRSSIVRFGVAINQNGGAERQAEKLAEALVQAGCRVTILTPRWDAESPDTEHSNGLTIERFRISDLSRRFPFPGVAVLNIPYVLWQIARAVRPHLKGPIVLHCQIASLQTVGAALAGCMAQVPVVCKAGMAGNRSDLGEIEKTGATGWLVAWLARTLLQTWVATTAAVEEALIRAGIEPAKIVRIPNGVDLPHEPYIALRERKVKRFLYLGRLATTTHRDIPILMRAFDRLALKDKTVELAIVGAGDLFDEIRGLAQTSVARGRIHVPGFSEPEKWLAWADCFVLPSRREGLSNALLEAMAVGIPCIANDIPPNREVLDGGNAGVLVPVGDCQALEGAMRDIAADGALARRLGLNARERAAQCYSLKSVADRYIDLFKLLLRPEKAFKHSSDFPVARSLKRPLVRPR
jgi:glycosyltransferase involved in cell wall biosynthesis